MTSPDWCSPLISSSRLPKLTASVLLAAALACADLERGDPSPDAGQQLPDAGGGGGAVSYASAVHPLLASGCQSCHSSSGAASSTAYLMTGEASSDFGEATSFIDTSNPPLSRLLRKASGQGHGGGTIYPEGSPEYQVLLSWASGGASP
jgi:hypothetical protein